MKHKIILIVLFSFFIGNLNGQVSEDKEYKNSISLDVGNKAIIANYYRQLAKRNFYALNLQLGAGSYYLSLGEAVGLVGTVTSNAYLNNLFSINKHSAVVGIGGEANFKFLAFMGKIGYQYDVLDRFSVSLNFYHWIWGRWKVEDQFGNAGYIFNEGWNWDPISLQLWFTVGVSFKF